MDVPAAAKYGLKVVRVPAYSPRSVAEHALALTFALARNLHLSHQRISAGNYTLSGLIGVELSGKVFGVVGTGKIGAALVKLLQVSCCQWAPDLSFLVALWNCERSFAGVSETQRFAVRIG